MATQSLYRRYRPRRFSEVKGQDHVVQALRTAVIEGREGQAYLFSGPRGTGKTTSARILAKVLNCTNPQEGEPCCECDSCLAVERGTSYDVHELDAASNNGVDSMRDLIEKASLGTPGRHKVYILDEVHMLTKGAEAALLKTLEEPPSHVVFVLATTDPQKMSDTIRSRTQHLQFHLFSADTLQEHVRWIAEDAGLDVSNDAIQQVVVQGAGSARDALSALELVANTGGEGVETVPVGELVEAMIDHDPGRALTMVAGAITLGRDPRTLTEELIGYLRNGFLSMMAPDLVQLPSHNVESLSDQAQRLGAAGLVRGIEQLGEALTEMRYAPDPRVLLDVAIVRLTSDKASSDVGALVTRVAKLEKMIADGVSVSAKSTPAIDAEPVAQAPADAESIRAGSSRSETGGSTTEPSGLSRASLGGRARGSATASSDHSSTVAPQGAPTSEGAPPAENAPPTENAVVASTTQSSASATGSSDTASSPNTAMSRSVWEATVRPALRGMARAVYAPAEFQSNTASSLTLLLPNPVHRDKCEQHRTVVEKALSDAVGAPITLTLVLAGDTDGGRATHPDGGGGDDGNDGGGDRDGDGGDDRGSNDDTGPKPDGNGRGASEADSTGSDEAGRASSIPPTRDVAPLAVATADESPRQAAERKSGEANTVAAFPVRDGAKDDGSTGDDAGEDAEIHVLPQDHEVDINDLVDAPPESVKTPIDRLAEAFPGSELVDETY